MSDRDLSDRYARIRKALAMTEDLDDLMCPHSAAGRPERFPAKACILAGECGCVYGAEWSCALRLADDAALETLAMTTMTFNGKTFEVDDEIASIVHALNAAGISTVASCSGHGMRPGRISLADGRELFVLPSYEIGQWFETQFPRDINGQTKEERAAVEPETALDDHSELLNSDNPSCVAPTVRWLKIRLNDARWSSPQARASGLRRLAIAALGSRGVLDEIEFGSRVARLAIQTCVPTALRVVAQRHAGEQRERLLHAADQCEREPTREHALRARAAAYAAAAAAYADAADAASAAADAAAAAADAASYAYAGSAYADAAYAAYAATRSAVVYYDAAAFAADAAADAHLSDFAEGVVQILIAMDAPGCAFLHLTEAA